MKKFLKTFILAIFLIFPSIFCLTACDLSSPSSPSKHTHDYSKIGYDSTSHWYYCKEDNIKKDGSKENHYDSNDDGYCDVCSFDMSEVHIHDYSVYDYDSGCHWKACSGCRTKDPSDTKETHFDDDANGECDVCGWGMPITLKENISFVFKVGENYKVLRIEGAKPSGTDTVKLYYYDKDNPKNGGFIESTSIYDTSYIFLIEYDKLTYTDDYSPVYIFDLYSYTTRDSEPQITKIKNKNYLEYTYYKNSIGGKTYWNVLSLSDDAERLAIQPEAVRDFAVTDIKLEEKENNLYMYVSAVGPKDIECVKLKAYLSGNSSFVDDTSENLGKFEFCINLSTFDEGYITFSLCEYSVKNPSDLNDYWSSHTLLNNSKLRSGESVIIGDKQYTVSVGSSDIVSINITAPSFTITNISLEIVDSKPCLLISAISPTTLSSDDVIIRAKPNGSGSYEIKEIKTAETVAGKFEFCLDLSMFRDYDMEWINISYGIAYINKNGDVGYDFTDINPSSLMSKEEIIADGYKYYNYDSTGVVRNFLEIYITQISE